MIKTQNRSTVPENGSAQQNLGFNNMIHNPALITYLQSMMIMGILAIVAIPGILVVNRGPSGFVSGNLPGLLAVLVVSSLFYGFNKDLRKFVWRETKERFNIGQTPVQDIELGNINQNQRF